MNDREFKYELFFNLSPDMLCIAGYDGYFKKINASVSRVLGYSMEELYSRPINDFVFGDDKEITARVRKELTRQKPLYNFENRYVTKSGEIVWLSWTSFPVESEKLIFAIAKNITHKKRLETERNALLSDLTEKNKSLEQLTYTTSHDLRSPVNNFLSLLGMIDNSAINDAATLEIIEVLRTAGKNLKQTLNKYVDSLKESHEINSLEELSLSEILAGVLDSVSTLIKTSNASVIADFSAAEIIKFRRSYLESIFLNLITNSIKYSRPDIHPEIRITSASGRGFRQIIYKDNGIGFDMEKTRDKVFGLGQKFTDHAEGKGIGLYLINNYVTGLGGEISIDSKINEGTIFTVSFRD